MRVNISKLFLCEFTAMTRSEGKQDAATYSADCHHVSQRVKTQFAAKLKPELVRLSAVFHTTTAEVKGSWCLKPMFSFFRSEFAAI